MLLAVLANRFDGVVREMTNTMLKTGRSAVINSARDFSCGITTASTNSLQPQRVCQPIPMDLIYSLRLCADFIKIFEAMHIFIMIHTAVILIADHTIIVPVFWEGEHLFNVCAKAHQADISNSIPYLSLSAKDVYEEGFNISQ